MSHTTKTSTTNERALPIVSTATADASDSPPVTAETKVHGALLGNAGATTTELAKAAGVGRSTAAKILARWAVEGVLIRTAGKDQRAPDTWSFPDSTNDADETVDDIQSGSVARDIAATNDDGAPAGPNPREMADPSGDGDAPSDGPQPPEADPEPAGGTSALSTAAAELTPVVNSAGDDATEEPDAVARDVTAGDAAPDDEAVGKSSHDAPAVPTPGAQKDRLPKGGLYELVKAYLAEHPGDSFGPAKIGTALSRSSGAVSNALDKLVVDGHAVRTCEAPKRFAVKSGSADAE